ncbi:hypothetical protein GCM10010433_16700 [Streptomyces pulveraceus]|uniref:DUF2637 domain-containing protein n=1 Tax=Streptomyces pulveraceus TaxID=68258 RepID=A0ABW1GP29_9ACTN
MKRPGKILLVVALVAVVGMAFRVSWNALRDIARAIGADSTAADLYPFVVDGLMALALIATLVLTDKDRRVALWVLGGYTGASLVLNYVHGLVPALHQPDAGMVRLAHWDSAHYALVLVATSLPVGAIFFGSDLVAKVLHHRTAGTVRVPDGQESTPTPHTSAHPAQTADTEAAEPLAPLPAVEPSAQVTAHADAVQAPDPHTPHTTRTPEEETTTAALARDQFEDAELERMRQDARRAYGESVQAGRPLSARALGEAFGMSESWGRKQILAARDDEESSRPHLRAVEAGAM